MAAITAFLVGIILGPLVIKWLTRLKVGQQIRGEGIPDLYEKHQTKAGTPTMGGDSYSDLYCDFISSLGESFQSVYLACNPCDCRVGTNWIL